MKNDATNEGATLPAQDAGENANGETEAIEGLEQMVISGDEPDEVTDAGEAAPAPEEGEAAEDETDEVESEDGDDDEGDESEGDVEKEKAERAKSGGRAEVRIHKLTAQRNEAREKAEAAEKQLEALRTMAESNLQLQPEYLTKGEAEAIHRANQLIERKEFLMSNIGVGYDDEKDESKSLTPKQIAEELVKVDRQWDVVVANRRVYEERKSQMLSDMKAGRALRLSREALSKNKKTAPPTVKSVTQTSQSATRPVAQAAVSRRGQNADRFAKSGRSDDAAIRELEELIAS